VGQTLRLRAAPSRALWILQNCRGAGRVPAHAKARPTSKCPNLKKLSGMASQAALSGRNFLDARSFIMK